MGRETTVGKENPRAILKGTEIPLILAMRQRQAPDEDIVLLVTNPRISDCQSPDNPFLYLFCFSVGGFI
jgi:hypothetical protein